MSADSTKLTAHLVPRAFQALGCLGVTLFLALSRLDAGPESLYPSPGIRPAAVRQGRLGSCYFHAVVAALALSDPPALQKMIQENADGTYTVQFADGKKETSYPEDIRYTREVGYDRSEGLWVAVIFRAYAQRVLRQSLSAAVDSTDLFPLLKQYAKDFIGSNDALLLAYDRSIRTQVDQYGNIDRIKLENRLKEELAPLGISDEIKTSFINLLGSGGFFDAIVEIIQKDPEIFGAYRAVGRGGIAERVMQTLAGRVEFLMNESERKTAATLEHAAQAGLPLVACTGGSHFYEEMAKGHPLPADSEPWYVNSHCYTVLAYNRTGKSVTLRNPWATHPEPDGVFSLPVSSFAPAFRGIITTQPPLQPFPD